MVKDSTADKMSFSIIVRPTAWLLERLRYGLKFSLLGGLLLSPVFVLGYLQFNAETYQFNFNNKESYGVAYVKPVAKLMHATHRYRIATLGALTGDSQSAAVASKERGEVDAAITLVDQVDKDYGDDNPLTGLKTSNRWKQIRSSWDTIKSTKYRTLEEANAALDGLTGMMFKLVLDDACNYSNLILDPDLDSYYLMDAFCIKLPSLSESIADQAAIGMQAVRDQELSESTRVDLAGLYKIAVGTAGDLISLNAETIYKETKDASVQPALEPVFNDTLAKVNAYGATVRTGLLDQLAGPTTRTISNSSLTALESVHKLYDAVAPQLDKLIQTRAIDRYYKPRTTGLLAVGGAVLLMSYLFYALFYSVRRSIDKVKIAADGMVAGTVNSVELGTADEIGDIASSFNSIAAALGQARDLRTKTDDENSTLQEGIFEMLQVVSRAASGELTVRARVTEGALGNVADAFNQMMESLQSLLSSITAELDTTLSALERVTGATEEMALGSNQQVSGFAEAQTLITKFTQELAEVSTIARTASDAAKRTEASAKDGGVAVADVIQGMEGLRSKVQGGAKKVKSLGDRSMEITAIVATIARISEQTNMLALNAAIEAVRAGEHGHGFSIVADEVRKLAERTASATQEIERLVRTIQVETNESVEAIEQQTAVMEREVEVVGRAGEALSRIQSVSTETAKIVDTINRVSEEQANAMKSVEERIVAVTTIARNSLNSARVTVEQLNALKTSSGSLTQNVRKFKVA